MKTCVSQKYSCKGSTNVVISKNNQVENAPFNSEKSKILEIDELKYKFTLYSPDDMDFEKQYKEIKKKPLNEWFFLFSLKN